MKHSALAVVVFVVLCLAGSASASTFCVNEPACVAGGGTGEPDIQSALTAALPSHGATPPSTVSIGPGTYGGHAEFTDSSQITVRGAGRGKTILSDDVGAGPGRLSTSRRLAIGRYTLRIVAVAGGTFSQAKKLSFTIVK